MTIIELAPLENGAHRNQSVSGKITPPEGWAVIPAGMELPATFPFVDVETDEAGQITSITANQEAYDAAMAAIPEPAPETPDSDVWEALDAAYQQGYEEGVNNV